MSLYTHLVMQVIDVIT